MEMAGLIALAQGLGVLIIAGLVWPLVALTIRTRQRRPRRALPPRTTRRSAPFWSHHES